MILSIIYTILLKMKVNVPKSKYKIVLLGDQHVGKTAIINRFINNTYDQTYNVLILIKFRQLLGLIS